MLRLLIKPKPGVATNELKANKILTPLVMEVYKKIEKQARAEVINILEKTPKIRAILKD